MINKKLMKAVIYKAGGIFVFVFVVVYVKQFWTILDDIHLEQMSENSGI